MDDKSPAYENFMNKMTAMNSGPKINVSTMKIGGLEKRVANNEKKITKIKNIFKAQKIDIGDKISPKDSPINVTLEETNEILRDVSEILTTDYLRRQEEEEKEIKKMFRSKVDIIITSGAVSAGKFDFVPSIVKKHKLSNYFKGVAIRPGKPILFAKIKDKSKELALVVESIKSQERDIPGYISVDEKKLSSTFVRVPQFAEVPYATQMDPKLVIEYYSR